ncbi:MAG: MXAN_6640 family putative metalloprotease [Myxococcota bacterium]
MPRVLLGMAGAILPLLALAAPAEARPDAPVTGELPPFFDDGDLVERYDAPAGLVRIHYTRAGRHAVASADVDEDGVPDVVALAGATVEEAWQYYTETLGFRAPLDDMDGGGDGRFDVYLLRFELGADGAFRREGCGDDGCWGYAVLEADFRRRRYPSVEAGLRVVGSHELFHAVQAAYPVTLGVNESEGTATWATESFDGSLGDFEAAVNGYLERPDRSLDQEPTGPIDSFSYGTALFFRFLEEQHPEAPLVRDLLENPGPAGWLTRLDQRLAARDLPSFATSFDTFARWNLSTGYRAGSEGYGNAGAYPELTVREVELPFEDDAVRVFRASTRYYRAPVPAGAPPLRVELVGDDDTLEPLTLIAAVEDAASGALRVTTGPGAEGLDLLPRSTDVFAYAAIAHGATEGGSQRPAVCFGVRSDVAECAARLGPPDMGAPDMGVGDAGPPDMGAGAATGDGGGCRSAARPGAMASPLLALVVLSCRRRRRGAVNY